jgi:hypothetical protein
MQVKSGRSTEERDQNTIRRQPVEPNYEKTIITIKKHKMKAPSFIKAVILSIFFSLPSAHAGHAIYTIAGKGTTYGNGAITKFIGQGFLVYDPDTKKITAVSGLLINKLKLLSVVPFQNYRIEQLMGPNGSSYTVFAKAESPGTQFAGTILDSSYYRGINSVVTIDFQGPRSVPRTLIFSGQSISQNTQTGVTVGGESTGKATLDIKESWSSNLSESHDEAVARLKNILITRGFVPFTPPPAE